MSTPADGATSASRGAPATSPSRMGAARKGVGAIANVAMTEKLIRKICSEQPDTYSTPSLNDKLYLQSYGFARVENLEKYTGVRALHLEGNGLDRIEGIAHMTALRALFLDQNSFTAIEGVDGLEQLSSLSLASNRIEHVGGELKRCSHLQTLNLCSNMLASADAVRPLLANHELSVLDLSKNPLAGEGVLEVLAALPALRVLYMTGTPFKRDMANFRRHMISGCAHLTYLDDRPVSDVERIGSEAWARGGREAEVKAKEEFYEAKRQAQRSNRRQLQRRHEDRKVELENFDLPTINATFDDASAEELASKPDCVVCQEPMTDADGLEAERREVFESAALTGTADALNVPPKSLSCGHLFHAQCLCSWLARSLNCPTCRNPVAWAPPVVTPASRPFGNFMRAPTEEEETEAGAIRSRAARAPAADEGGESEDREVALALQRSADEAAAKAAADAAEDAAALAAAAAEVRAVKAAKAADIAQKAGEIRGQLHSRPLEKEDRVDVQVGGSASAKRPMIEELSSSSDEEEVFETPSKGPRPEQAEEQAEAEDAAEAEEEEAAVELGTAASEERIAYQEDGMTAARPAPPLAARFRWLPATDELLLQQSQKAEFQWLETASRMKLMLRGEIPPTSEECRERYAQLDLLAWGPDTMLPPHLKSHVMAMQ